MSVLTSLLKAYNISEQMNLVDNHNGKDTVLLPLYHQSKRAVKGDTVKVTINKNGNVINAKFLTDEVVIFPITEDSVARSGKMPPPHPLEDKMGYCINSIANPEKYITYRKEFDGFYNQAQDEEVKCFLTSIALFLDDAENFENIINCLFQADNIEVKGAVVEKIDEKGKTKEINFEEIFLCFSVEDCDSSKTLDVSTYKKLHKEFISYVEKTANGNRGLCNISGTDEVLTEKHRGLLGTAKIISVSNNKETYIGRFKKGTDIIRIGRKTSEKIHLMLKFLLENKNSSSHLADSLFLVNWFETDVMNERAFDITSTQYKPPVAEANKDIARAFKSGDKVIFNADRYYIMLIDKSSNGRISIRYYRELAESGLKDNLDKWQTKYHWVKWDENCATYVKWIPSLEQIIFAAYGIERNNWLYVDKEKFKKDQYQKMIMALMENRSVPKNIKAKLSSNVRNRQRYKEQWNFLFKVALAVLSEGRKEYNIMRPLEKQSRSYLLGRLLAVYEKIETDVLVYKSKGESNSKEPTGKIRSTNAERLWNSFAMQPGYVMRTLESKTKPYAIQMKTTDKLLPLYKIMDKVKQEIITELDELIIKGEKLNTPLDDDYIFGYNAQKKILYSKKETRDE